MSFGSTSRGTALWRGRLKSQHRWLLTRGIFLKFPHFVRSTWHQMLEPPIKRKWFCEREKRRRKLLSNINFLFLEFLFVPSLISILNIVFWWIIKFIAASYGISWIKVQRAIKNYGWYKNLRQLNAGSSKVIKVRYLITINRLIVMNRNSTDGWIHLTVL